MAAVTGGRWSREPTRLFPKTCRAPAAEASAAGTQSPSKPKDREVTTTSLTKSWAQATPVTKSFPRPLWQQGV